MKIVCYCVHVETILDRLFTPYQTSSLLLLRGRVRLVWLAGVTKQSPDTRGLTPYGGQTRFKWSRSDRRARAPLSCGKRTPLFEEAFIDLCKLAGLRARPITGIDSVMSIHVSRVIRLLLRAFSTRDSTNAGTTRDMNTAVPLRTGRNPFSFRTL